MTTYKFADVEIGKLKESDFSLYYYETKHLLEHKIFYDKGNDEIIFDTFSDKFIYPKMNNGLLNTISHAYNHHVPLILKPDDLWLNILIVFMKYKDRTTTEMEEKQVFTTKYDYFEPENINFWLDITKQLRPEQVSAEFTTTTDKDRIIANIAIMSAYRKLILYRGEQMCGLSEVTLRGTADDWLLLIKKTKQLLDIKDEVIMKWRELLIPVLEQFYQFHLGDVNEDWWQRCCTSKKRGSSDDRNYAGWILAFSPFNNKRDYILRSAEEIALDHCYAISIDDKDIIDTQVDVDIVLDGNNFTLWGGTIGSNYDQNSNSLTVSDDFAVIKHKTITFEIFHKKFMERKGKDPIPKLLQAYETLTRFYYLAAEQTAIPNNNLMALITDLNLYTYDLKRDDDVPESTKLLSDIYAELSGEYCKSEWKKYFKPELKDSLIAEFLTQ